MNSDEQTAAETLDQIIFSETRTDGIAAIVRALQAARKEGGKQVVDEAERVSQSLQSANTANADSEAKARFEVDRFAFACAGSVVGSTLTDYQKHALFHQFKNMFDSHESALRQAARTPPPGHIIDDAGVVLKLSGALPVTADRVVVCYASTPLWHPILGQMDTLAGEPYATWRNGMGKRTSECYSTPEAAEAAKEGKA